MESWCSSYAIADRNGAHETGRDQLVRQDGKLFILGCRDNDCRTGKGVQLCSAILDKPSLLSFVSAEKYAISDRNVAHETGRDQLVRQDEKLFILGCRDNDCRTGKGVQLCSAILDKPSLLSFVSAEKYAISDRNVAHETGRDQLVRQDEKLFILGCRDNDCRTGKGVQLCSAILDKPSLLSFVSAEKYAIADRNGAHETGRDQLVRQDGELFILGCRDNDCRTGKGVQLCSAILDKPSLLSFVSAENFSTWSQPG
ncbi:hypothetical protein GE061_007302 [Apolygus lucorum]|uniref:Uncharacterized protein n=1 Tax=Apolygus lucorum TaxID=248454 RepID=A0A6A4JA15_APOLU|nr:hypothetical protein GE061_007302 [Apolygus lucorum]